MRNPHYYHSNAIGSFMNTYRENAKTAIVPKLKETQKRMIFLNKLTAKSSLNQTKRYNCCLNNCYHVLRWRHKYREWRTVLFYLKKIISHFFLADIHKIIIHYHLISFILKEPNSNIVGRTVIYVKLFNFQNSTYPFFGILYLIMF